MITVQIIVTDTDNEELMEEWTFDAEGGNLSPFQIATAAKDGAKKALQDHGLQCSGDTH